MLSFVSGKYGAYDKLALLLKEKPRGSQTLRSSLVNNMHVRCLKLSPCGRLFPRIFFVVLALVLGSIAVPAARGAGERPPTISLDQIKPGMTGVAYTIFAGDNIEPFDIEVIGILPNLLGPKQSIILVQLHGEKAEHTGVVAGMSGSPVYIDGKLAGALSLKFGVFVKEPLGGVTPIENILSIPSDENPANPKALSVRSTVADNGGTSTPTGLASSLASSMSGQKTHYPVPANYAQLAGASGDAYLEPIASPCVFGFRALYFAPVRRGLGAVRHGRHCGWNCRAGSR